MSLPKKVKIISASLIAVVLIGGIYLLNRSPANSSTQYTDDAYIQADFTIVAPRVAGQINQVLVENNQVVKAGELLARIDDRDLVVAVDSAKADVESAKASVESLKAQIARQGMLIKQAGASVSADDASIKLAQQNLIRYQNLSADGSGSKQDAQEAQAQLHVQQATRKRDEASKGAASLQVDILRADLKKAQAQLSRAEAALNMANLNLSYTKITAPIDGIVDNRSVREGAFVGVGTPLLAVVPLDAVYVEAKYRETQLANIRPGQKVKIKVDALSGVALTGKVTSIAPASGITFSPIAPHNATGNFTKIVQRLPVRIQFDEGQNEVKNLRVGMSVQPTIDIEAVK